MAVNKNALIRFKIIDKCLQNRYRKWTLDDLIYECSEALYEYEGIDKGVSKRTIQADIQMMRSDKLGYNAPILVVDRKYYTYEDADYSITNIPITDQDLGHLAETVEFLKQFKGFSHFKDLDGIVQKLEDHVYSQQTKQVPVIDFEKNERLTGIDYLSNLHQAIIKKEPILMTYQSFKARGASSFVFHCYLLKEYRNRWFILGRKNKGDTIINLALDRIVSIEPSELPFKPDPDFNPATYFKDTIGVSVSPNMEPDEVILFVTHKHAPYVATKPFHESQKVLSRDYYGVTFSLSVQHNFELEKEILGLGDGIKVIAPERLRQNIQMRLNGATDLYRTELNPRSIKGRMAQLTYKGYAAMNHIYTKREINKIGNLFANYYKSAGLSTKNDHTLTGILKTIPQLTGFIFNKNILSIIKSIDVHAFIVHSKFYNRLGEMVLSQHTKIQVSKNKTAKEVEGYTNWVKNKDLFFVTAPETILKNLFTIRIYLDDITSKNGALQVVPGSNTKIHTSTEAKLIIENSIPVYSEILSGGIQLVKPLTIQGHAKNPNQKKGRVLELVLTSSPLPDELNWVEQHKVDFSAMG